MSATRLTPAMKRVMRNLHEGRKADHGVSGMSAHGGLMSTVYALIRRGWVDAYTWDFTPAGRDAAAALFARAPETTGASSRGGKEP